MSLWKNLSDLYNSFVDEYEYFDYHMLILEESLKSDQNFSEVLQKMNDDLLERFE